MKTFRAIPPPINPADPVQMTSFLSDMQSAMEEAAVRPDSYVALAYLEVAPTRPQDGVYFAAAGVLGANRGAYRYDSTTGLYTFGF